MGMLPRSGGGNGGSGNGGGCCAGDVNIGIVMGADGKPSALSSPDLEAVKKALATKADLVNGKVPLEQLPPIGGGAVGDKGPTGDKGPAGDKGLAGDKGPDGDKGPRGEAGPAGAQGPAGEKGPQGDPGPVGPQGPVGSSVDIINTLDSDRTDAALSAAQGKNLGIRLKELGERTFVKLHREKDESLIIPGDSSKYWMVQMFVTFDRQPSAVPHALSAYSCVFAKGGVAPAMAAGTGFLTEGGRTLPIQALLAMNLIDKESFEDAAEYFIFVGHLLP